MFVTAEVLRDGQHVLGRMSASGRVQRLDSSDGGG